MVCPRTCCLEAIVITDHPCADRAASDRHGYRHRAWHSLDYVHRNSHGHWHRYLNKSATKKNHQAMLNWGWREKINNLLTLDDFSFAAAVISDNDVAWSAHVTASSSTVSWSRVTHFVGKKKFKLNLNLNKILIIYNFIS